MKTTNLKGKTMFKELVETLLATGRAQAAGIVTSDELAEGQYYLRESNGEMILKTAEKWYTPKAENVADFVEVIAQIRNNPETKPDGPLAIFVGEDEVFAYLAINSVQRHCVKWELKTSDAFARVVLLEKEARSCDHRTFLKMLRLHFWDAMPPGLYDNLREVRFTSAGDNASAKSAGKVSIGKSIAAELAGASKIPEIVTFNVPVFERAEFTGNVQPIRFDLDVDPVECSFKLTPLSDETTSAILKAQQKIQMNILQRIDAIKLEGICVIGSI